jgi:hypothetical protein
MTVHEIYNVVIAITTWLANGGWPQCNDPAKAFGVKRLNILFQLEY